MTATLQPPAASCGFQHLRLERRWLEQLGHLARQDGDTELVDLCQRRLVEIAKEINRRTYAAAAIR